MGPNVGGSLLQKWFPTTSFPVIISAPMIGTANGTLAAEVSKVGGFGIVPGTWKFGQDSAEWQALDKELSTARRILELEASPDEPLPVGVGFLTFDESVTKFKESAVPMLTKHKPLAIWLFAPQPDANSHESMIKAAHECGAAWGLKVFVQVGSLAAAREAIVQGADAVVAQGVDAGGHQWAQGASIISLVPELREMIRKEFPDKEVALAAAGGIAEGSGVAAAVALGAEGAVMGTRFIVTPESWAPEHTKHKILSTTDGGVSTVKSFLHDDVQGTGFWPQLYDGRAIIGPSIQDEKAGLSLQDNIAKYKETQASGDMSRKVYWCGCGVGLINQELPAGNVVVEVREKALQCIQSLTAAFK